MKRIVPLIVIAWLVAACQTMKLKDLDQDLPLPLVERYAQSTSDYADESFFWLPLLILEKGHVARTHRGFQAEQTISLGPLFLIARTADARFDERGVLRDHESQASVLWGLITSVSRHAAETTRGWRCAYARSFLFGLFGYEQALDGGQTVTFLFLPIPWHAGDADVRIANPPSVSGS